MNANIIIEVVVSGQPAVAPKVPTRQGTATELEAPDRPFVVRLGTHEITVKVDPVGPSPGDSR